MIPKQQQEMLHYAKRRGLLPLTDEQGREFYVRRGMCYFGENCFYGRSYEPLGDDELIYLEDGP